MDRPDLGTLSEAQLAVHNSAATADREHGPAAAARPKPCGPSNSSPTKRPRLGTAPQRSERATSKPKPKAAKTEHPDDSLPEAEVKVPHGEGTSNWEGCVSVESLKLLESDGGQLFGCPTDCGFTVAARSHSLVWAWVAVGRPCKSVQVQNTYIYNIYI